MINETSKEKLKWC